MRTHIASHPPATLARVRFESCECMIHAAGKGERCRRGSGEGVTGVQGTPAYRGWLGVVRNLSVDQILLIRTHIHPRIVVGWVRVGCVYVCVEARALPRTYIRNIRRQDIRGNAPRRRRGLARLRSRNDDGAPSRRRRRRRFARKLILRGNATGGSSGGGSQPCTTREKPGSADRAYLSG